MKQAAARRLLLSAIATLAALPAFAHVTAHPDNGVADSYFETKFQVPHGCSGSSTVAIRIKIPADIGSVKAQMKPGWNVNIKTRKLDKPITGEGGQTITETVDEVDWQGGPLPDNLYDEFGLVMKLPPGAGKTIYFPVVQECQKGVNRWINIPAASQKWNEVREPAPFVVLTQAVGRRAMKQPCYLDLEDARQVLAQMGIELSPRQMQRAAEQDAQNRHTLSWGASTNSHAALCLDAAQQGAAPARP